MKQAAKNPEEFQILYDRYFTAIFNYIFRKVDEEQITADLTSQTFLKALKNIRKYTYRGVPFSAWLYRIACNEINKFYNQNSKRRVYSFDEREFEYLLRDNSIEAKPDYDLEEIVRQMHTLCEADIQVLELRFFESKSFAEMAFILEITEANAKMKTYRAIDKLRKLLIRKDDQV